MRARLLSALAGATLLTVGGAALPASPAAARVDCAPVIDKSATHFTPTTLAITSKGYKSIQVAASFTAPCGEVNGSDIDAAIILSSEANFDGSLLLEVSDGVYPSTGDHEYGIGATDRVHSGDLSNSWAGTWTTQVDVTDNNDDPVRSYDVRSGPDLKILRAAAATANATPEPVKQGKKIAVKGKLTRANWNTGKDSVLAGQSVALEFKPKGGSYATVTTVTSSTKGAVKAKVTASTDGYFRFVFAGLATTSPATSSSDYINVT